MKVSKKLSIYFLSVLFLIVLIVFILNFFDLKNNSSYDKSWPVILIISVFFSTLIVFIQIGSLFFDRDSSINALMTCIGILLFSISSEDSFSYLEKTLIPNSSIFLSSKVFFIVVQLIAYFLIEGFTIRLFIRDFNFTYKKHEVVVTAVLYIISILLLGAFLILEYIKVIIFFYSSIFIIYLYWLIRLLFFSYKIEQKSINAGLILLSNFSIGISFFISTINSLNTSLLFLRGIPSLCAIVSNLITVFIYIDFAYRTTKSAYKNEISEQKIKELQSSLLTMQINPHYIFNSLNTIKNMYSYSQEKGDKGLELLSKNLRQIVNMSENKLISLNKELDNVLNYVEFENLKQNTNYNVIFDIDSSDFLVPPLSIVTLIENSLKYSKINEIEGGFILISTFEEKNYMKVRIYDNGVGFNLMQVASKSSGIKNTKERFKLLLRAKFIVKSKAGEGTEILIEIPKGDNHERISN